MTGSGIADALASIAIGALLCFIASRLTRRNRQLLTNQSVPERYVEALRARLESQAEIHAVTRLEAVYLGPGEVLVAADVAMADGLSGPRSRPRWRARGPTSGASCPSSRGCT